MIVTSPQDLWSLHRAGFYVCDPTNLTLDAAGRAVMGAGISRVVRERWPNTPERLGRWISTYSAPGIKPGQAAHPDECTGRLVFLDRAARLVYLPTKYHWRERADPALIERGLGELADLLRAHPDLRVALPRLGSGLGGLDWEGEVRPLLMAALDHPDISPRVVLATPRRD